MQFFPRMAPRSITIIATYRCTASCTQCCFSCSPRSEGTLTDIKIRAILHDAKREFPSLAMAIFTGGEATLLKAGLLRSITAARDLGLSTRLVSNGHWGKTASTSSRMIANLSDAGLDEINLSTGLDHQQWIPPDHIVNSAKAAAAKKIPCVIAIEADTADQRHFKAIANNTEIQSLLRSGWTAIQTSSWIQFTDGPNRIDPTDRSALRRGCDQIFDNLTITPYEEVSACCGLTLSRIGSMHLGSANNLGEAYRLQHGDFLKFWLRVDGPYTIIERLLGSSSQEVLKDVVHPCEACSLLHNNKEITEKLFENHRAYIDEVMTRFSLGHAHKKT